MKQLLNSIFVLLFFIPCTHSQISLVTDFENQPAGSYFDEFVETGRFTYFIAGKSYSNLALWRTDGTYEGTFLLTSLENGRETLDPGSFALKGDSLFFFNAPEFGTDKSIWVSDGTVGGTRMIYEYNGTGFSQDYITRVNNIIYFTAHNNAHGEELWVTDGTTSGTHILKDINQGSSGSGPRALIELNGILVFECYPNAGVPEIWRTDGTWNGTYRISKTDMYFSGYGYDDWSVFKNNLFFKGTDGSHGEELWKTDGTEQGTMLVKDIMPGSANGYPGCFIPGDSFLYFMATDKVHGFSIWRTDGTDSGTILLFPLDIHGYSILHLNFQGSTYFYILVYDGVTYTTKLLRSDGSPQGSITVKDFGQANYSTNSLIAANGRIYFNGYDPDHGSELWQSNGTPEGTFLLKDIFKGQESSSPHIPRFDNGRLFLTVNDTNSVSGSDLLTYELSGDSMMRLKGLVQADQDLYAADTLSKNQFVFAAMDETYGNELWTTSGTPASTYLLKDLYPGSNSAKISGLTIWNDELYFAASKGITGMALYRTGGQYGDTVMIKWINNGKYYTFKGLNSTGKRLFFTADDGIHGQELWVTDGTETGTFFLKDIYPGTKSSSVNSPLLFNDELYFFANDSVHGDALWKSDGTLAGTVMVKDIFQGTDKYYYSFGLIQFGNKMVFCGDDSIHGRQLWMTDGTGSGTYLVSNKGMLSKPFEYHGLLYFTAWDNTNGYELWRSDGTASGTELFTDLFPGYRTIDILGPVLSEDRMYILASNNTNDCGLFRSDGTVPGTELVKSLGDLNYFRLISTDSILLFTAFEFSSDNIKLYRSDGTDTGTYMLLDSCPGYSSEYAILDNRFYFAGMDSLHGIELWSTDGSKKGTWMVGEINQGTESSEISHLVSNSREVYFLANSNYFGQEIYKYQPLPSPATQAYGIEFFNIGKYRMSMRWHRGSGEKCIVYMKQANSGQAFAVDGRTYRPSAVYSVGSMDESGGWFCIYNGTGNEVTVTGLLAGTEYRVMVMEYNETEDGPMYDNTMSGLNPANQSTLRDISETNMKKISVFPNPSQGLVYLADADGYMALIYNSQGRLVQDLTITSDICRLDLSRQAEGLYIMKFICDSTIQTRRLIIAR